MRKVGLAPLPMTVPIAVRLALLLALLLVLQGGLAPGIAAAAEVPAPSAAPASAANPAPPSPAPIVGRADAGSRIYRSVCVYCHYLGDGVSDVGAPGLKGALHRYGEAWLEGWLADPGGFAKDDAKARALIAANPYGLVMPALSTMQDAQNRADVIAFLRQLEAGNGKDGTPAQ